MPSAIHLDTNFLIYYVGGSNESLIQNVEAWLRDGHALHISAIAWAEFLSGPLMPEEHALAAGILDSILPVTAALAAEGARLFQQTGRRSRSLADYLIAATAISERVPLATMNSTDFEPFVAHGIKLV